MDASVNVPLLQVPTSLNRGEGDIHIYGNPHYWLDPANGKIMAQNICNGLVRLDPDHRDTFTANLQRFDETIDAKIKEWTVKASVFKNTKVIVYHNEWPYFEQRFGIVIADYLEPKPGIPPTPSQLAKVIGEMKRDNIKIIINSPYFTSDAADLVARNSGAKLSRSQRQSGRMIKSKRTSTFSITMSPCLLPLFNKYHRRSTRRRKQCLTCLRRILFSMH